MKLTPDEKTNIETISNDLSDLLVNIYETPLPEGTIPTKADVEFTQKLKTLYFVCPPFAEGFEVMYNHIQNAKKHENIFETYAKQIWQQGYFAKDEKRWHTSGYHINEKQLTIEDTLEDASEVLNSITPDEVKIEMALDTWNEKYVDNPEMIAAMAKQVYSQLKEFGRYAFKDEPDWNSEAKQYIEEQFRD